VVIRNQDQPSSISPRRHVADRLGEFVASDEAMLLPGGAAKRSTCRCRCEVTAMVSQAPETGYAPTPILV